MAGAVLGAGLAVTMLASARPGASTSPVPATVRVSVAPTGELEVTPSATKPVLIADALMPGERPASASFQLRNQTGTPLAIELSTTADSTVLDGLVRLRLSADGDPLTEATLQGMQHQVVGLDLASGAQSRLRVQAWIPKEVNSGYEGRLVEVALVPTVKVPGGSR